MSYSLYFSWYWRTFDHETAGILIAFFSWYTQNGYLSILNSQTQKTAGSDLLYAKRRDIVLPKSVKRKGVDVRDDLR